MESRVKIIFYWQLIGICYILHNLLHLSEIYYGKEMLILDANGVTPMGAQIFTILVSTMPFILAVLSLNVFNKGFLWASFVWSVLLACLNTLHLAETLSSDVLDFSQIVLLLFVLVVNLLLSVALWKSVREQKHKAVA
ncbi:hypothetical protein [Massilibacteroides sp.]|uniref:hypothetical protein n=1 Tax=Massilibacteroides sp. TaxID=2034766 RepID=UPI0026107404|nr:hypothetical protein [Massilibacteroides sp.]MDD4513951.1 hypothetical protein [Massilibacteroides sp.]